MARDGSGNYSLPSGNPVVPNTVISSGGWANPTLSDIAAALTASIAKDGQTVPTANLPMGNFRHTNVANALNRNDYAAAGQVQDSAFETLSSVSGTNAITANSAPAITTYTAGQCFRFVSAGANTGAVTLNINGLGAKNVTKNGATALASGDIPSGAVVQVVYDGTQFQLTNVFINIGAYLPLAGGTMSGAIAMGGNSITGIANAVNAQDAVAKNQLDAVSTVANAALPKSGGTITGQVNMVSNAPVLLMQENDQTLPAGLWRIVADGNQWFIRRNTAAAGDFSSEINAFTLNTSTDATFYGNVTAYSDERLKKDWTELPDGIIEDMAALLSGTFTRVDTGQRQVGVGAQSLHRFLPEAVLDGEKLSVAYGNAALAIITKLCQRVVKMDARIAELEAKQ
ncbi:hypothetical protein GNZ10_13515 [Ralstonia sp. 3N]|uniref:tail fiber domain-containing protein n=1 Tax=Ralstonia sp. 3N TaxID=2675750 RepID=UPI0015C55A2C|nr:hypothetical protein [Ralstonia sp. 3N]NPT50717.1 hypothetical protein [Ralstonia sp. 3N]